LESGFVGKRLRKSANEGKSIFRGKEVRLRMKHEQKREGSNNKQQRISPKNDLSYQLSKKVNRVIPKDVPVL